MLALVFAVVSLSSIDPDPIVTPAPQIHDRLAATGFAPGGVPSGFTSDITVAPACTFGVPRFGNSLWNDAASLARLAQPQCPGMGSSAPWLPAFGRGVVRLQPTLLRSPDGAPATSEYAVSVPARFTALAPASSRGASGPVFRVHAGAEPIFARVPSGAPRSVERRH